MRRFQFVVAVAAAALIILGSARNSQASTAPATTAVQPCSAFAGGHPGCPFGVVPDGRSPVETRTSDSSTAWRGGDQHPAPPAGSERKCWYDSNGNLNFVADPGQGGVIGAGSGPDCRSWEPNGSDVITISADIMDDTSQPTVQ